MQGCSNSNGVLFAEGKCNCTTCSVYFVEECTIGRIDEVHERCSSLFTDTNSTDNYESILKLSNTSDLKEIERDMDLELLDNKIILNNPISFPVKFMLVLAFFLVILLIVFIIFSILSYNGLIHIPGIDSESLINITKWIGVGLCMSSLSYLVLVLGYAIGCSSSGDGNKFVIDACRSRLKDSAAVQKKIDTDLAASFNALQSCEDNLRLASGISDVLMDQRLSNLERECSCITNWVEDLKSRIESVNVEIEDLENAEKNNSGSEGLDNIAEQNKELTNKNDLLRIKYYYLLQI
ncbi:putative membrane protein [Candidatus Ichthyocystis hellenicum]|uniref:Putative membrane protein n=1 Tax=Candidatus Ichthyocystis hellenicum TaxID=1561003 RepID=A0A0S4M5M5_9BURK|nr:hypothetical protein [Candidatus Ichthyocystis hellenicum]CUT17549.1 putative membrane protein [Candidatus Ichthyocystis hellenicum]